MRVESNPQGKLHSGFLAAAFEAHPYRNPPGGWPSDLMNLRVRDAKERSTRNTMPVNMVVAVVGDVNPVEARRMAEQYFGPLPARPLPPPVRTV